MLLFYGNSCDANLNNIEDDETAECLLPGFVLIDNLRKSKSLFLSSEDCDKQRTSMVHCTLGMIHNGRQEPDGILVFYISAVITKEQLYQILSKVNYDQ